MFVDFDKVFNDKPQLEIETPTAVIDYLNQHLPDGVKYIIDKDGDCVITSSKGDSISLGGFLFVPDENQKAVLGPNFEYDDVIQYFYNAQKNIPLKLKKEGFITVNGEEIPVAELKYNPLNPIEYVAGSFFMVPSPFPKGISLKVGNTEYEKELFVSRIPHESISEKAFESSKDAPLSIKYFVNEKTKTLQFNMSYNLSYASSVRDIVESTSIFNSFLEGKGYFCGEQLNVTIENADIKKFDENSIIFWKKVLMLEEALDVTFVPPKKDIDFETICLVEKLYQNIINQVPVQDTNKIDSINGEWEFTDDNSLDASIGTAIYFEFDALVSVNLFDVKLSLPSLLGIFNAKVDSYSNEGSKYKLYLEDISSDKPRYTSIITFKTEDELKKYKQRDSNERITLFHDAKKVYEYLV